MRICPCNVPEEDAVWRCRTIEKKRQVRRERLILDLRDKDPESVDLDEIVNRRQIVNGEMFGSVHRIGNLLGCPIKTQLRYSSSRRLAIDNARGCANDTPHRAC